MYMGLIRGGLLFVLSLLIMIGLLAANLSLTFSLSLEDNSLQSVILSDFSEVGDRELDLTKEVEENFDSLIEHCENNTNFEFGQEGYEIDIPCEIVDQGPEAVIDEAFNDLVESVIEQQYPDSSFRGFSRLLFSNNASEYWMNYFYIILGILFTFLVIMFFIIENRFNIPISFGFLLIISSLPFAIANILLPFFTNTFLNPLSILFAEAYTVFLGALILGVSSILLGFGLKFFNIGWSLSEKIGKIKRFFTKKSKSEE